ncbi:MFS transporter [Sulfuracidifex tepidarius]|uniref:Sialic acid transporter n=1 Tax=Sulfuracidifex tepidarius TaxID=1294262 RepID=A0A510DS60_9CREN|nr:MFS transporter [Sulfuracidifex tepidarius]BBG23031.1 Putative sialic acid transporter [Sulfuracidifex tepidarius]BBG25794.1 Putative sialic acid transporter [Sulfuracidifex tepidarius]
MVSIQNVQKYERFMRLLFLSVALGGFTDLYDTAIVGGGSLTLIKTLHLTSAQFGLFGASTFIGGAVGAFSFGLISDKIGRKKTFVITLLVFIISELLISASTSYVELLALRLLVGFGIGADYPPALTMLSEYSSKEQRGRYLIKFLIVFSLGGMTSYFVATALLPFGLLQWRLLFLTGAIPPMIALILRRKLPESPRWYATKGMHDKAEASMEEMGLEPDISQFTKREQEVKEARLFRIFLPLLVSIFAINLLLNLPLSGLVALNPIILSALKIPSNLVLVFSGLAFLGSQSLGAVLAYPLYDKVGRIRMLLLGSAVTGASLILMSFLAKPSFAYYLVVLLAVAGIFASFYLPVIYSLSTEIFPTKIRGTAQGMGILAIRIAGIIGIFGGSLISAAYGTHGLLLVYGVINFVAFFIALFTLYGKIKVEGRELEDISDEIVDEKTDSRIEKSKRSKT